MEEKIQEGGKYTPQEIANYFLWMAHQEKVEDMTQMKLIKLVYIAYAWHLALFNKKLFDELIEAWKFGPVIPSLYHEFKEFGCKAIKKFAMQWDEETENMEYPVFDITDERNEDATAALRGVWAFYKDYTGLSLMKITHKDNSAWKKVWKDGCGMDDDAIEKIKKRAWVAIDKFMEE